MGTRWTRGGRARPEMDGSRGRAGRKLGDTSYCAALRVLKGRLFNPSTDSPSVDTTLHLLDPPTGPGQLPGAPAPALRRLAELRNLRPSRPHSPALRPFTAPTSHPSSSTRRTAPSRPLRQIARCAPPPPRSAACRPCSPSSRRDRVQRAAARAARLVGRGGAGDGDEVGGDAVPRPARGARRLDAGRRRFRPARLLDRVRAVLPALVPARGGDQARRVCMLAWLGYVLVDAASARRARARSATSTRTPRTTRR